VTFDPVAYHLGTMRLSDDDHRNAAAHELSRYGDLATGWRDSPDPQWMLDVLRLATEAGMIYRDLDRPLRRFAVWCAKEVARCRSDYPPVLGVIERYANGEGPWEEVASRSNGVRAAAGGAAVCGLSKGVPSAASFICGCVGVQDNPFEAAGLALLWAVRFREMEARAVGSSEDSERIVEGVPQQAADALREFVASPFTSPHELDQPWVPRHVNGNKRSRRKRGGNAVHAEGV
jgi:hypothetical protein